ncbi:hypothetical protein [Planomicrobium sp. CPCC 101110]|uniref:hypothetical protein n=1 Tax=Planomicrobium sp. CPCC 101110 TaxID=2599619 RepID=UPI0011B48F51|nr:hypothetical protein [Planomicrobium sp. CPCC 101110]TWT27744.1 hypothetical protein FQV30_04320 [Planomicrobium sp. CPCC 101110]
MRRPLINTNTSQKINVSISPSKVSSNKVELTGLALDKRLRQKRSKEYINGITKLDAGGVICSHSDIEELKQTIQNEFPDLSPSQYLIGIISKCYLGKPYVVHTLDLNLDIVKHYEKGESLPASMDRGKGLALHPRYEFIEVYNDSLRAVSENGDVAVIKG